MNKLFLAWALFSMMAIAADREGNPGEIQKLKFMAMVNKISFILRDHPKDFPEIDFKEFSEVIEKMDVRFVREELPVVGQSNPTMMNFPDENMIKVNRLRWTVNSISLQERMSLIFHEILGLMKKGDGNHLISSRIVNFIDQSTIALFQKFSCQAYCVVHVQNTDLRTLQTRQMLGVGLTATEAFLELEDNCQWLMNITDPLPPLAGTQAAILVKGTFDGQSQDWLRPYGTIDTRDLILANTQNSCMKDDGQ